MRRPRVEVMPATVRGCDFFEFARKTALKTKGLRAIKVPENRKSHKL
jgi:hypothetical protein